jgi:arylsulfatase A-like enzyme
VAVIVKEDIKKPNILVILADQHRWDCTGFNGNAQVQTPHLDQLAADGVNYPETTCAYPVCTPSRYSFFSGLYVHQHGAYTNHCTLDTAIPTFPRRLREHGYRTAAVGKMHFTPTYLDIGFDEMALCEQDGDGRYDDDYHRGLMAAGLVDAIDLYDQRREYRQRAPQAYWDTFGALPSDLPEEWHSTTWIGDRAVETLESWSDQANLLVCSFVKPHHPFDPPQSWIDRFDIDAMEILPGWLDAVPGQDPAWAYFDNSQLTEASLKRVMACYYAAISQIDHQVGRMVEALRRRGRYGDTLIVYASDHGEYLGFHHMILKQGHPYEPLVKVPLVVKYPGLTGAGESRETLSSLIDVAPTILAQTGIPAPQGMAGFDLADAGNQRQMAFSEHMLAGYYMARSARHKLIWDRDPAKSHFFDLQADPLELNNLIDDPGTAPLVAEFKEALSRWLLFDSTPVLRLDEDAVQIDAANVPRAGDSDVVRAYIDRAAQPHLD